MVNHWKRNLAVAAGGVVLTAVGFVVIPPIVSSLSRKVYKAGTGTSDIDFNNMGPEIVRKSEAQETEV